MSESNLSAYELRRLAKVVGGRAINSFDSSTLKTLLESLAEKAQNSSPAEPLGNASPVDTASGGNPAGGDLIHRIYASAVALAAEVVAALNSLRLKDAQIATLKSQLPPEMQHCTIRFVACEKGHGRLIGTNWTDEEGCLKCKLDALTAPRAKDSRSQTLAPTMRLRWRQVFNIEHETVLVLDHPERGPARYVLEQAFHRPDSGECVWSEIEVDAP